MTDAQVKILIDEVHGKVSELKQNLLTKEDMQELKKKNLEIAEKIELGTKEFQEKHAEILEIATKNAASVDKLEAKTQLKQGQTKTINFRELAERLVDSPEFKEWAKKGHRDKSDEIIMKDVSLSGNYTDFADAPATLTFQTDKVGHYPYQQRPISVRDVIPSVPVIDPHIIAEEITDFVNFIDVTGENTSLVELNFTVVPKTWQTKRIGASMDISRNMMRSRAFIVSEIERQLPLMYRYVEDFQLLNGDGTGNNVEGLFKHTKTRLLTGLNNTYATGDFASIEDFGNGQTLITFTAAHGLFDNYTLTLAATTGGTYDGAFAIKVHSTTKVVIAQTFTSDANVNANWTGTAASSFNDKVDNANTSDVASAVMRQLRQGYFVPSALFINPTSSFDMERAKNTTADYLGNVVRDRNGVLLVDGVPVIEIDVVPATEIWIADTLNAARIYDYEGLTLRFVEDAALAKKNQVSLLIYAQIAMGNFNPLMTMKATIAQIKTDLETP